MPCLQQRWISAAPRGALVFVRLLCQPKHAQHFPATALSRLHTSSSSEHPQELLEDVELARAVGVRKRHRAAPAGLAHPCSRALLLLLHCP